MRKKKDSALGVKYVPRGGFRAGDHLDEISNMEAALHTFVTPVVGECEMIGDYRYGGHGHGVSGFGDDGERLHWRDRKWKTRTVVLSASIHMDFEGARVMLKVCKLDDAEVVGRDLGEWEILSAEEKQSDMIRERYDDDLRRHMVFHLTRDERLPARMEVTGTMDMGRAIQFLEDAILAPGDIADKMVNQYAMVNNGEIVSLELLFNTAVHQARNEFSALEALCSRGYVYTYDPASIFANKIGGAAILNRLMVAALKHLSDNAQLSGLAVFAFNDYADQGILALVEEALVKQKEVRVVSKAALFKGPDGKYDIRDFESAEGAMLVIHNNSDGFGQNIETESEGGSLDGAIGSNCSGAASLERGREDLLDFLC
jgi:hypothetical protein